MVALAKDGKVEESSTLAVSEAERVIYTKDAMLVLHENKITALKHAEYPDIVRFAIHPCIRIACAPNRSGARHDPNYGPGLRARVRSWWRT